ncbi:uncharacterized protein K452DRAFT_290961 [Aplosporella prunicola CBS 121167]|uniref:ER lumen protein-retaining receptor n=1 Tax=Aplosporella prunicola CBS 121167 TaxID=1176127 RepID=A0A6A6B3I8_9PEZI|nr:uncharacterized protein K452DRAFT_290961 [Aplosporella prunicola CBS 121167]KAF2138376.1 hypothetical protein K452DRAFT_290961 [Aplosporella prunicola CBS 121167]
MGFNFNIFRILGDLSHASSQLILIGVIHSNQSAEGVSLLTQLLYLIVFCARYVDLFWTRFYANWHIWWNFCLKIYFIATTAYTVFIMARVFSRTREREKAMKLAVYALGGSFVLTPFTTWIFSSEREPFTLFQNVWTFSIILESVCVLPQLLLLRQTTVPTVLDSFYLTTLGSYRAFYILNWLVRGLGPEHNFEPIRTIFGVIQTALYVDFAWVYWTRQRVKLRGGGVVDGEDLRKGWLLGKVLKLGGAGAGGGGVGRRSVDTDADGYDEEAAGQRNPQRANRWGARGISVSADEGVLGRDAAAAQPLTDPAAFVDDDSDVGIGGDDDDDDDDAGRVGRPGSAERVRGAGSAAGGAGEVDVGDGIDQWRDEGVRRGV